MAEFAQPRSIMQRYIVVDDDRMNNLVSKFIIQRHNKEAEIQLYTDPELALAEICELSSNADDQCQTTILLDINMPMMNGWEFLEQFKNLKLSTDKQFRIYMISSSIDPSDKQRAADHLLISGFFSKPLNVEHLKMTSSHT
jgi:CheY-like chemotaxis protein